MAKSVNQVFLIGRLVADVDLRATTTGKNVASFSLAVDKASGEGADFFEITAWDKLAELLSQYTHKGSKVHIQGRLQQQSWEDKDSGKKRSKVVITANDVTFLDSKQNSQPAEPQDVVIEDVTDESINLDDIPF